MNDFAPTVVSVAIGNLKSKIENLLAGVVQWQNGSFPSCTRGFDSPHPLFIATIQLKVLRDWLKAGVRFDIALQKHRYVLLASTIFNVVAVP